MKLENQVCSLEHAKKLKELGVKQESLWQWIQKHTIGKEYVLIPNKTDAEYVLISPPDVYGDWYSAFTVAELGEMLPDSLESNGFTYLLTINHWDNSKWNISYDSDGELLYHSDDSIFSNAMAKMLIWLIEQGKVKP